MHGHRRRASIVVNNYNYVAFLGEAIESALGQTHPAEVIVVVDDGSTDGSRAVIAGYEGRVVPVLKENGGQASAINAGFASATGEIVLFLDADDGLLPTAVEAAHRRFRGREPDLVKVAWPLYEVDRTGSRTGRVVPDDPLPEGDLRASVPRDGPAAHINPPTSGNAWSRSFLEQVLPMPEEDYRIWADVYLLELAPCRRAAHRARSAPRTGCRGTGCRRAGGRSPAVWTRPPAGRRARLKQIEYLRQTGRIDGSFFPSV